jgi:acyl-CoA thioesterase I
MARKAVVVSGSVAVLGLVLVGVLVGVLGRPGGWPGAGVLREVLPVTTTGRPVPDDARLHRLLAGSDPVTWVFVGDSITEGVVHTHGRRSFVEHFAERTRGELGRVGDVVINTGVSGDRSEDVLAGFGARVARFRPDVVVVMLGTNDSVSGQAGRDGFRHRISRIVTRVRALHAVPVLQTPTPVDASASPERADLGAYANVVREVAEAREVVLVDHYTHWLAVGHHHAPQRWLDDAIHPNARGHLEMARTLVRRLQVSDRA